MKQVRQAGGVAAPIGRASVQYVEDVSAWDEWQRAYIYGAFYIFPPAGIIEPIDELRRVHDPRSHATCQAHISLTDPLLAPLRDDQIAELASAVSTIDAFDLQYGPLRTFLPHPGVAYAISPAATVLALRSTIHGLSAFVGVPRRADVAPHLTIAEFISVARTQPLVDQLQGTVPTGGFRCDRVEYAVPDDQFHFSLGACSHCRSDSQLEDHPERRCRSRALKIERSGGRP
jgi:2'-5' RNA ligase